MVDFGKLLAKANVITVAVPEWGGDVQIAKLTALAQLRLADLGQSLTKTQDGKIESPEDALRFTVEVLAATIVDGDRRPFDNEDGRRFLQSESFTVLTRLMNAAMQLNGLGQAGEQAAIDAAKKN